jgi:hypothetical protein
MGEILKSSDLNVDQKARQYIQLQNDFLQYKKKFNSSLQPTPPASSSSSTPASVAPDPPTLTSTPLSTSVLPNRTPDPIPPLPLDHHSINQTQDSHQLIPQVDQPPASLQQLQTPVPVEMLTPPSSSSPVERKQKRPRYDLIKNHLDDDAHKVVGPYLQDHRTRRSRRIRNRYNPLFD